uniref:ZW10 protein n=1 Tax=Macrostomum lignano TaxID=282301 RepID=A0A1I8IP88_9PLAT
VRHVGQAVKNVQAAQIGQAKRLAGKVLTASLLEKVNQARQQLRSLLSLELLQQIRLLILGSHHELDKLHENVVKLAHRSLNQISQHQKQQPTIMAHLLGSEYCLKSLSSDARDLHNVLQELIAKAGPVPVMSWKFPDKKACDLDIPYLLQHDARDLHNVLQELIAKAGPVPVMSWKFPDKKACDLDIPYLLQQYNLLLQVLSQFILTHLPAEAGQSSGSQTHAGGSSLGLAAKKFWNRMGQMSLLVRQLTDEARLSELRQQQQKEEFCSEVQHGFSRISAHLSALCEKERLPSSLRIYRAQLQQANGGFDGDWLAASDLNADLTAALEQAKTREVKFDQDRAADAEKAAKSRRELESKMDKLVKQYEATVDQLSSANKALEASKLQLMKDIEAAKKSIEQQEELIKLLDRVKNRVKQVSKRDDLSLEDLELARLKSQVSDLQTALQKSEDEKRLLIEYPDLNGPVNQDVEASGRAKGAPQRNSSTSVSSASLQAG